MATIYIVEDNQDHLDNLIMKIDRLGHSVIGTSRRAIDAFARIKETQPEIVLLDINLNGDNDGIVLARQIKTISRAPIIYVTAQNSKAVIKEAITSRPSGYLVKPIKLDDLKVALEIALHENNNHIEHAKNNNIENTHLTVRIGYKLQKVNYDNIKLLEAGSKNYVTLTTIGGKKHLIRSSLKTLCENVLPGFFVQIHRRYVINMNFIQFVNEKEQMLLLEENTHLPIGRTYKAELYRKLNLI
ncbi:MAG: response regulator transcription factor [Flavobacteriaceae bacterium]|nr:response regulator transcription factor [Flavobacteriaceae bacterium]